MKTEADIGMSWAQAKEYQRHQKLEYTGDRFFSRASRGSEAQPTLWFWTGNIDFGLVAYRTMKEETHVTLSQQVCGNL